MARFLVAFVLAVCVGSPGLAFGAGSGVFEDLEFVGPTRITGPDNAALALCYTTNDLRLYDVTLSSTITGYALVTDNCTGTIVRRLTEQDVLEAQASGQIDATLPAVARNGFERNIMAYGIWVAIALALVAVIMRRVKSLLGYDLRGPMRKSTTKKILSAMCQVGQADSIIDAKEMKLIKQTASRLTRRSIRLNEVVKTADHTNDTMSDADYIALGRGMRDHEKDVMMRGVFYVALASGRLLPQEYDFLTKLAYGIGMPGEDFRRVMNQALADLDLYPPY